MGGEWREMRDRGTLEAEAEDPFQTRSQSDYEHAHLKLQQLQLEVLLDIRDLLENADDAQRIGAAVSEHMKGNLS